ncbi:SigE family RNA polymerase sigma factor [Cryptosporangium aurantiacum]|uniref:RNA polymerase sigma-70 factor, sigma-E family n=1 Tax=Cryptosporangium aurantiacum TaxID=134849 RepID=A0A1M7TWZ8_9ACTN|nr:SigE family RNA polymerase sigma factor [Cryptosporangium aurantiacum]SHN75251.1 RNA polymerase sigma-70 factor, sigma-E family [Cryptosporangium aurantiacum]
MHRRTLDAEFAGFVRDNRVDLVRTARLLTCGDVHRAEDLVQSALVRAYVAWNRIRGSDHPVAYVRRSIVNAHIDESRRPFWRRERSVAEPPEFGAPESPPDDLGDAVRAALGSLPPKMRAVVVLRHWLDLSVEQTAEWLGCTEGTVKSQNAKAVAKLRHLLAPDGAPAPVPVHAGRRSR